MENTYPLKYTGQQIDEKLSQLEVTAEGLKVTNNKIIASGNVEISGKLIVGNKEISAMEETSEETVKLANDLYAYTSIGKITGASNTSRELVAAKGETLKTVFDKVFGTQQDEQPSVSNNSALSVSAGKTSYGGGEYGTPVSEVKDVIITFTLNNTGTASYGYTWEGGSTEQKTSATFYYPITKQKDAEQKEADIKSILPDGQTAASSMVTTGTFVSANSNVLYCNFNDSKKVSIKISLPAGSVTTSTQTRYGQISASVILGAAQKEDQLTAGTAITKFLTYLGNDATTTSGYTGGTKSGNAGPYTISAGSYYNYYLASPLSTLSSDLENPVTTATQYTSTSGVSINCATASHIWFLLPPSTTGTKTIQYEPFANTWVDAFGGASDVTNGPVDVALELDSGAVVTYKGYYTSAKAAAGSNSKYKIV